QQTPGERLGDREGEAAGAQGVQHLGCRDLGDRAHAAAAFFARSARQACHRYSTPLTTVRITATDMSTRLTTFIHSPATAGSGPRAKPTAIDCAQVFTLPRIDAAIT